MNERATWTWRVVFYCSLYHIMNTNKNCESIVIICSVLRISFKCHVPGLYICILFGVYKLYSSWKMSWNKPCFYAYKNRWNHSTFGCHLWLLICKHSYNDPSRISSWVGNTITPYIDIIHCTTLYLRVYDNSIHRYNTLYHIIPQCIWQLHTYI